MVSALLVVLVIVAVGTRLADGVRVRQQEIVLRKLPEADARAYYELLRRRARKVVLLRAVAILSLLVVVYTSRQRLVPGAGEGSAGRPAASQVSAPGR